MGGLFRRELGADGGPRQRVHLVPATTDLEWLTTRWPVTEEPHSCGIGPLFTVDTNLGRLGNAA